MHILSAVHTKFKHGKKVEKRKKLKAQDAEEKRALELGEEVRSQLKYHIRVFIPF
jgi:ribosome production factor 1